MCDHTTERIFDSQAMQVIAFGNFFVDMLSMGVCTTRHWQTSGRLVQDLNVCTVLLLLLLLLLLLIIIMIIIEMNPVTIIMIILIMIIIIIIVIIIILIPVLYYFEL